MRTNMDAVKIVEDDIVLIHPALDFTNDMAIITLPLPTQRLVSDKKDNVSVSLKQEYWVITSKKERFVFTEKEFLDRDFFVAGVCYVMGNRWHYRDSLKKWLDGNISVDVGELFSSIKEQYKHYLDYLDPRLYTFMALWTIGTYFFPLFNAYPIVFLNGRSGTGKSKTIDVTEHLAFNAINTSNISDASIYRVIQGTRATLLLDENERIANSEEAKTLINLVLAGFKKGAKVIRLEKSKSNSFVPTKFEVHCPKMIANIRGIHEEALKNRCIPFTMTPTQGCKSTNYPTGEEPRWQEIRNNLYIFMMNNWQEIRSKKKNISETELGLNGYSFMMWQPILTFARYFQDVAGIEIFDEMLSLSKEKISDRKQEEMENYDRQVLKAIKGLIDTKVNLELSEDSNQIFLTSKEIHLNLKTAFGYEEGNIPSWFTPQKAGRMVNSLDIGKPKTQHNERGHLVDKEHLQTILERFGIN